MKEFFAMGGYALYVWGSFSVTAVLMIAEPIMLRSRKKAAEARIRRMARLDEQD